MISLSIHMVGDGAFEDNPPTETLQWSDIAFLEKGTASGRGSVAIRLIDNDGKAYFAETTWRLLRNAVRAFEARYGEQT